MSRKSKQRSKMTCCYPECLSSAKEISFFWWPSAEHFAKYAAWEEFVKVKNPRFVVPQERWSRYLCQRHFSDRDMVSSTCHGLSTKRLYWDAVPSVHLVNRSSLAGETMADSACFERVDVKMEPEDDDDVDIKPVLQMPHLEAHVDDVGAEVVVGGASNVNTVPLLSESRKRGKNKEGHCKKLKGVETVYCIPEKLQGSGSSNGVRNIIDDVKIKSEPEEPHSSSNEDAPFPGAEDPLDVSRFELGEMTSSVPEVLDEDSCLVEISQLLQLFEKECQACHKEVLFRVDTEDPSGLVIYAKCKESKHPDCYFRRWESQSKHFW